MSISHRVKICFLDIETSPLVGYAWATYDTSIIKVLEHSKVISCSWKFLGSDETYVRAISDYDTYQPGKINDEALVKEVWRVLDESDIVVAHYGIQFDFKKLNARFVYYGLNAPSSYQVVDTKKEASRHFKFDSNSLNSLSEYFGIGSKVENGGFGLWERCIAGDKEAWDMMKKYNTQDVVLLEKLYLILRPFIKTHPNVSLINEQKELACPSCAGTSLSKRGFSFTRTGRKQRYQCNGCASWSVGSLQKVGKVSQESDAEEEGE